MVERQLYKPAKTACSFWYESLNDAKIQEVNYV